MHNSLLLLYNVSTSGAGWIIYQLYPCLHSAGPVFAKTEAVEDTQVDAPR